MYNVTECNNVTKHCIYSPLTRFPSPPLTDIFHTDNPTVKGLYFLYNSVTGRIMHFYKLGQTAPETNML